MVMQISWLTWRKISIQQQPLDGTIPRQPGSRRRMQEGHSSRAYLDMFPYSVAIKMNPEVRVVAKGLAENKCLTKGAVRLPC
jgi:hypothetical protein